MQGKLPLSGIGLLYECANIECFYDGTLLNFVDCSYKEVWNSELGDLDLVVVCPSCHEPMMVWMEVDYGSDETQLQPSRETAVDDVDTDDGELSDCSAERHDDG